MKIILKVVLLIAIFGLCPLQAESAPVGNLAAPAMGKDDSKFIRLVTGFETDMIFDRKLKDIDESKLNFYSGKAGLIFNDRVLVYGLLGAGNMKVEFDDEGSEIEVDTKTGFAWGIGAKAILYETEVAGFGGGVLRFGGDIKFRHVEPDISTITINGDEWDIADDDTAEGVWEYDELQLALGLSYQMGGFIPYLGVKYTDLESCVKGTDAGGDWQTDISAEDTVGMFAGADIMLTDTLSFNVEGRFLNEQALSVGGVYRF